MASSCQGSLPSSVTKLFRSLQPSSKFRSRSISAYKDSIVSDCDFKHLHNPLVYLQRRPLCASASALTVYPSKWAGDIHISSRSLNILTGRSRSRSLESSMFQQNRGLKGRTSISSSTRYYDVLGIAPSATQRQIKSAYYNMSKLYHPDVSKGSKSHAVFTEINEAYEVLGNLRKRRMYDRGIYTRNSSLGHAEEDMTEDYTAAYKTKGSPFERGDRPPPPRGRTNVYNFDEFYRQHYNEIRERRAMEYKEFVQHQENLRGRGSGRGEERYYGHPNPQQSLLVVVSTLMVLATLAMSMENYDRDLIGSSRAGSSHPNYYGAVDPLHKIPVSSSHDKDQDTTS